MKKIIFIIICLFSLFCGCKKELPKVTLEEIKNTDLSQIGGDYQNLKLPDRAIMPTFHVEKGKINELE